MSDIIIVKNNTGTAVFIEDMGIEVPGAGQKTFSDIFDFIEICVSEDLKILTNDSTFIINDGTDDLSISDAIEYLECKSDDSGGSIVFGDISGLFNLQSLDSNGISSTTSTTYQDKLTIIIPVENGSGTYLFICNADFQATNNNKQVACRLYNKTNAISYNESVQQTNNSTNWFSFACHESIYFDGLNPVTIAAQYRNLNGTSCNIRNCNLSLWRIG